MVRKLMAAAAVSGLMLSTAFAEMKTEGKDGAAAANAGNVRVITAQQPNQWLGSTLIGMTVVDPDDNTIGEVDDLLVEKSGKIEALVVGVGGFLGIGEKDIALPMSEFTVVPAGQPARDANAPRTTANNPSNTAATRTTSGSDRLRLSMTKDQLKQHAEFKSMTSARTTGSGASSGTAPRPGNPAGTAPRDGDAAAPKAGDKPESNR